MADRPVRRGAPASPGQADQLPKGAASKLNTQLSDFDKLQAQQNQQVAQLQSQLAAGQLTQGQYSNQIGDLWNTRATLESQQLAAQGKDAMAEGALQSIGGGAGGGNLGPFGKPHPEGVDLGGQSNQPTLPKDSPEELLFSPTDRPDEHILRGFAPNLPSPPPADILNWVQLLAQAANQPGAPEQLKILYSVYADLLHRLPQQQ